MSALAVQAPARRLVVGGRSVTVVRGPIVSGEGGVSVHGALSGRDAADSHPLAAVTGLGDALAGKAAGGEVVAAFMTHPGTLPAGAPWAGQTVLVAGVGTDAGLHTIDAGGALTQIAGAPDLAPGQWAVEVVDPLGDPRGPAVFVAFDLTAFGGLAGVSEITIDPTFGPLGAALAANRSQLAGILDGEAIDTLGSELAQQSADAALAWAQLPGCSLLTLNDDDYPCQLAEAGAAPPLLFARGRRDLLATPMLAIVGSRNATPQGEEHARTFARRLAAQGYTIVSGLAGGIDAAAHEGALQAGGHTIAVIGTGIDRVYPASNRQLAHQIAEQGLILSEFALGMGPLAQHFPRRNRIIAGLSRGCLVVEATLQSGSLITARQALEAGREVMAIPGSILNPQARGCHRLIKEGARLVETVDDVLDEIGRPAAPPPPATTVDAPRDAPDRHRLLGEHAGLATT